MAFCHPVNLRQLPESEFNPGLGEGGRTRSWVVHWQVGVRQEGARRQGSQLLLGIMYSSKSAMAWGTEDVRFLSPNVLRTRKKGDAMDPPGSLPLMSTN